MSKIRTVELPVEKKFEYSNEGYTSAEKYLVKGDHLKKFKGEKMTIHPHDLIDHANKVYEYRTTLNK